MSIVKIYPRKEFEEKLWEEFVPRNTHLPVKVKVRAAFGKTLRLHDGRILEVNDKGYGYLAIGTRDKSWVFSSKTNYKRYIEEKSCILMNSYIQGGMPSMQAHQAAEAHVKHSTVWNDINNHLTEGFISPFIDLKSGTKVKLTAEGKSLLYPYMGDCDIVTIADKVGSFNDGSRYELEEIYKPSGRVLHEKYIECIISG